VSDREALYAMPQRIGRWQWAREHTELSWPREIAALIIGGAAYLMVSKHYHWDQTSSPTIGAVIIACLAAIAVYAAEFSWKFSRAQIIQEREALRVAEERLRKHDERQQAIDSLARLRAEGHQLLNQRISEVQLKTWVERQQIWQASVEVLLRESFTQADLLSFTHPGPFQATSYTGSINHTHNSFRQVLGHRIKLLGDIISHYSGQR
jgi:hypothetical protein